MRDLFRQLAERTAHAVGSPWAFMLALLTIAVWGVTGAYFKFSDTWQLFINTGTTIVTFLMVFLIQNTQNRETRIVALKLDELLRGVEGARTGLVQLDHMSDEELEIVQQEFTRLRDRYAPLVEARMGAGGETDVQRQDTVTGGDRPCGMRRRGAGGATRLPHSSPSCLTPRLRNKAFSMPSSLEWLGVSFLT